jgi:hypothetical protein
VSLGGKLTYVLLYATTELLHRRYDVIFGVLILFYCIVDDLILLFGVLIKLLGLVDAFFCCS